MLTSGTASVLMDRRAFEGCSHSSLPTGASRTRQNTRWLPACSPTRTTRGQGRLSSTATTTRTHCLGGTCTRQRPRAPLHMTWVSVHCTIHRGARADNWRAALCAPVCDGAKLVQPTRVFSMRSPPPSLSFTCSDMCSLIIDAVTHVRNARNARNARTHARTHAKAKSHQKVLLTSHTSQASPPYRHRCSS